MAKLNINKKNKANNKNELANQKKSKEGIELKRQQEEKAQKEIIEKTNKIIDELKAELNKKTLFKKKDKQIINNQINELQNYLDNNEFGVLKTKIEELERIVSQEQKELEEINKKKTKEKKEKLSVRIRNFFKEARYPTYSRIKKIIENEDRTINSSFGKINMKALKIVGVILLDLLLIGVAVVGLLLLLGVINYSISSDSSRIFPIMLLAVPVGLLFAV